MDGRCDVEDVWLLSLVQRHLVDSDVPTPKSSTGSCCCCELRACSLGAGRVP